MFGEHKGLNVKEEAAVLEEINIRSAALKELFKMVSESAASKPDEQEVDMIMANYQQKTIELRKQLKDKFEEMRNMLYVQEHICETILSKNLGHIDKELKSLKAIDYRIFGEADRWLNKANSMLENFNANENVPGFIAFNMLQGAKVAAPLDDVDGEDLLIN